MEEILQSIKRIIAEEGEPATAAAKPEEVLELTEMVAEEESSAAKQEPATEVEVEPLQPLAGLTMDEIMAGTSGKVSDTMIPKAEPVQAAPPPPSPVSTSVPEPVSMAVQEPESPSEDALLSQEAIAASTAAMDRLKSVASHVEPPLHHSMPFRSGATVEDLVLESLRPMLREWLEGNLTGIVEHLVDREVRRLTAR